MIIRALASLQPDMNRRNCVDHILTARSTVPLRFVDTWVSGSSSIRLQSNRQNNNLRSWWKTYGLVRFRDYLCCSNAMRSSSNLAQKYLRRGVSSTVCSCRPVLAPFAPFVVPFPAVSVRPKLPLKRLGRSLFRTPFV